jgi:hypothetical protein
MTADPQRSEKEQEMSERDVDELREASAYAGWMEYRAEQAEAERDRLRAEVTRLQVAARSAVAALDQKMVYPADVDLAIKNLSEALADREPGE